MASLRDTALRKIQGIAPRFLPFADVATDAVPLSRLLRLSLFQVTVGMALVLLVGTLNRVMIVELGVPATIVGVMLALPVVFAPFRALIGFRSDNHVSAFGWRRVPYIWKGTLLQFGGFAIMPFALLVLSGFGESHDLPPLFGQAAAALAFLLVGAGVHMVQTVGLALATDLVKEEHQPRVVGLMYVMLLLSMIVSAFIFGLLLEDYYPGKLIQVIQGAAVVTMALNAVAIWKQEPRNRERAQAMKTAPKQQFGDSWSRFSAADGALRLLAVIALGTAGFGMADVLLEPYGGQVLGMSVAATTRLTAVLAFGTLVGFGLASRVLGRGGSPMGLAAWGGLVGVGAFALVVASASIGAPVALAGATLVAGFGAGLFSHGTLTATMRAAPRDQVGLALGAWGAVQTTAAGIAIAIGGIVRDVIVAADSTGDAATPYLVVFSIEIVLLIGALIAAMPLLRGESAREPRLAEAKVPAQCGDNLS
jgi:BCD family chlorophyll transporter-like MFS transporter